MLTGWWNTSVFGFDGIFWCAGDVLELYYLIRLPDHGHCSTPQSQWVIITVRSATAGYLLDHSREHVSAALVSNGQVLYTMASDNGLDSAMEACLKLFTHGGCANMKATQNLEVSSWFLRSKAYWQSKKLLHIMGRQSQCSLHKRDF